jgi:hypothetical protein
VPLEQAGISLEARGLSEYIRALEKIERKQKAVFEVTAKETGKSFAEVTRAAKKYEKELKDLTIAQRKAADEAKKLAVAQRTAAAAQQQAFISAGSVVLNFAKQIGTVAIESGKLAAQFQGQQIGLQNLSASFGQSGTAIQAAIQKASKGTISGLQAIEIANTGLLLGVAKTPAEFEKITKVATTLGRALGLSAERSIERFTAGLGRQSKLIIDDLGISTSALDAEIERIAQRDFGRLNKSLTQAQQASVFTAAALSLGEQKIKAIGDEAGEAQAAFERFAAQSENLQVTFGALLQPLGTGIVDALSRAIKTAQQFFAFLGAGFTGIGTIARAVFGELGIAVSRLGQLIKGEISFAEFREPLREFSDILDEAGVAAIDRFKEIASTIEGVSFDEEKLVAPIEAQSDALDQAEQSLEAYQSALQQAEQLQLSFARAAEDAAIKLARANEDVARKQAKSVADLEERQKKDRSKLLKDQQKQLDKFEKDRQKQIAKAESDIVKARKEASDKRKEDQRKLQRELQRAQERFNLSRLQSERRFSLSERRLRAEGDILAIQQLREDRELERKEEAENFGLSQKDRVQSAEEQQREQAKDLQSRVSELKSNLEDQRAELLKSFDEQFAAQQQAQAEAKAQQQQRFAEEAAERQIALQREEEDRRLSQQRQLEDLGRSLADQEGRVQGTNRKRF